MATIQPLALEIGIADRIRLSPDGRLIDFIDPNVARPNTPEERVRQTYARKLHYEYDYPKNVMVIGAPISIGSELRYADIAIYQDAFSAKRRDQAKIRLIVETKAGDLTTGIGQLKSYIFASSAQGGLWLNA